MSTTKYDKLPEFEFEFVKYWNNGYHLFSKGFWQFIGFGLVYLILSFIALLFMGGFQTALATISPVAVSIVAVFLYIGIQIFQISLIAGIFSFCRKLVQGKERFEDFFAGLKRFGQIGLHVIVLGIFFIPIFLVFFALVFPQELLGDLFGGVSNPFGLSSLISDSPNSTGSIAIVSILIGVLAGALFSLYSLTLPLIVDAKMKFWKAMETSRKVVSKKLLSFFGFYTVLFLLLLFTGFIAGLLMGFLSTTGTFGAIISFLVVILTMLMVLPFLCCILFSVYNHIIGPTLAPKESLIDQFGVNETDINTEAEEI